MRKSLAIRKETLTELTVDGLALVNGGETWSCNCTQVSCFVCLPTGTEKLILTAVELRDVTGS